MVASRATPPYQERKSGGQKEGQRGRRRGRDHKRQVVELFKRSSCQRAKKQCRQGNVEQEEVEPSESALRLTPRLAADKSDEDQPEIR